MDQDINCLLDASTTKLCYSRFHFPANIFVVVQRVEEIMTLVHQEQRMTLFDVVEPMSESEGAGAVGSVIKTVVCNPVDGYWFLLTMKSFSGLN